MKFLPLCAVSVIALTPAFAQETRQLQAHEHGVGKLNIAFDGERVAMELHAPGADIVGFEYEPTSEKDRGLVEAAEETLKKPLDLFVVPAEAGCNVIEASAHLEVEGEHEEHDDHAEHGHDEAHDDHEEHKEHGHDEHDDHGEHDDHEEHAEHEDHDEHGHEDHDEHDDHEGDDHAEEAGHTEFHAEYMLTCSQPTGLTDITFAYFETFPNALEVEVQLITDNGATSFEVERDAPTLDLRNAL